MAKGRFLCFARRVFPDGTHEPCDSDYGHDGEHSYEDSPKSKANRKGEIVKADAK